MTAAALAERLAARRARRGWLARCPGPTHQHGDRRPSLAIAEGTDGRVLVRCWVGCRPEEVMRALGLGLRDLFADSGRPAGDRRAHGRAARSPLDEARRDALARSRREEWRRPIGPFRNAAAFYEVSDLLRHASRKVEALRQLAAAHQDEEARWNGLAHVACQETVLLWAEAELDELLAGGRLGVNAAPTSRDVPPLTQRRCRLIR